MNASATRSPRPVRTARKATLTIAMGASGLLTVACVAAGVLHTVETLNGTTELLLPAAPVPDAAWE